MSANAKKKVVPRNERSESVLWNLFDVEKINSEESKIQLKYDVITLNTAKVEKATDNIVVKKEKKNRMQLKMMMCKNYVKWLTSLSLYRWNVV